MTLHPRVIVAAWLALALAGCPQDKGGPAGGPSTPDLPYAGRSVRIAVPAGLGFQNLWEGSLTEWQTQTGGKVELVEFDPADESQPGARFTGDSPASFVVFPLDRLGDALDSSGFAPIPRPVQEDLQGLNWLDIFAGLREGIGSPGKRPAIVPLSCPVLVCYYRKDLLQQAKLAPPKTWEDYQKLLDGLTEWAPGLSAVEPWGADFRATLFFARSLAYAKHPGHYSLFFDIETAAPLIDGPGFVRALETARRAWEKLDPSCRDLSPADCHRRMLHGEAAMAIAFERPAAGLAPETAPASDNAIDDSRIGCCLLPGSRETYNPTRKSWEPLAEKAINQPTLVGFAGWACGAPGKAEPGEIEAAWNAVSGTGSSGFTSGFPPSVIGLCRESQVASGAGIASVECVEAMAAALRDPRQVIELPVVRRRDFLKALSESLGTVLDNRSAPPEALQSAARSWKELADEIGAARVRDSYRAALGLSAAGR